MTVTSVPTEAKVDISVVQLDAADEHCRMLREVVSFLRGVEDKDRESEGYRKFANKLDKIFFCFYFVFGIVYFSAMSYVMLNYKCQVNHFDFWY